MSETGNSKPSIFSHAGLMTVIAAAISALAAVGVAYIQKSGPAEKQAEASASAAPSNAASPGAPVYVTKVINGKTVKVLVPAAQAGKAATGGAAATVASETQPGANFGAAAPEHHSAAQSEHVPAAEPEPDPPADSGDEGQ